MSQYLHFRITAPMPVRVSGPRTRWVVSVEYYGKNANKAELVARCLTNGKSLVLASGREGHAANAHRTGVMVKMGTTACRLAAAMVAQGLAEFFDPRDDGALGVDQIPPPGFS